MRHYLSILLLSLAFRGQVSAAVISDEPPSTSGVAYLSASGTVCTAHYLERVWQSFVFPTTQTIREIQWRGTYSNLPPSQFVVKIYPPGNVSLLIAPPVASYVTTGNADETPAGTTAGVRMFTYRFALPTPLTCAANTTYMLQIYALQPGVPDWAWQASTMSGIRVVLYGAIEYLQDSTFIGAAGRCAVTYLDAVTSSNAVIALTRSPNSGGTATGAGTYAPGTPITVTATPAAGFTFLYWKEGVNIVSTAASHTFTAGAYRALTAHFASPGYVRVALTQWPPIGGTVSGGGTIVSGQQVQLDATPMDGFVFDHWSEGDVTVSSSAQYTFNATSDHNLEANFYVMFGGGIPPYVMVRTRSVPRGGGILSGEGAWVGYSRNVYFTAAPSEGYRFKDWRDFSGVLATTPTMLFSAGLGSNFFDANFTPQTALASAPGGVAVKWPASASGWVLQERNDLVAGSWLQTTRPITPLSGQNSVTIPTTESQRFFRLYHP